MLVVVIGVCLSVCMLVVGIGVCLSVLILVTASAQVCVPLGHSSLYLCICDVSYPYVIYYPTVMVRYLC